MKRIFFITILIILIPFFVVTLLVKDEKKKSVVFKINEKYNVKVKKEDGLIIEVPFEEYIVGVVAAEMPANFEIEALKAQAVAARSYVLKKIEQNKNEEYDILDTTMNQVYIDEEKMKEKWQNNFDEYIIKIKQAVNQTKGEYLTYNKEVIQAFFFSTSSGKTENVEDVFSEELPYLRSVDSSWDEAVPTFSSTTIFTLEEFCFNLNIPFSKKIDIKIISKNKTGSIKIIQINDVEFKGTDFRKKLNIRSTNFDIKQENDKIIINTKGYGHGVGMSQYGANGMAKAGYTYDQILKHYYSGIEISKFNV